MVRRAAGGEGGGEWCLEDLGHLFGCLGRRRLGLEVVLVPARRHGGRAEREVSASGSAARRRAGGTHPSLSSMRGRRTPSSDCAGDSAGGGRSWRLGSSSSNPASGRSPPPALPSSRLVGLMRTGETPGRCGAAPAGGRGCMPWFALGLAGDMPVIIALHGLRLAWDQHRILVLFRERIRPQRVARRRAVRPAPLTPRRRQTCRVRRPGSGADAQNAPLAHPLYVLVVATKNRRRKWTLRSRRERGASQVSAERSRRGYRLYLHHRSPFTSMNRVAAIRSLVPAARSAHRAALCTPASSLPQPPKEKWVSVSTFLAALWCSCRVGNGTHAKMLCTQGGCTNAFAGRFPAPRACVALGFAGECSTVCQRVCAQPC